MDKRQTRPRGPRGYNATASVSNASPLERGPPENELAMNDCLFCRILRGEIPSKKVHEDEQTCAFEDIHPQGPTHVLVVPKKHIRGLKEAGPEDAEIIGRCHLVAAQIARQRGIENGYRTVVNVGPGAGQSVFHLHVHLIGGRPLHWPPG
jgi:histidine triad (HIT) family protein